MTDQLRRLPKVVLHDHLDGGLRPATIVELASEPGFKARNPEFSLPSYDPDNLAELIQQGANSGSLVEYLKPFAYTVGVMQTPEAITRIAAECVEDLAADGVIYAESRFAPELSTAQGLSMHQVVEAVLEGFALGVGNAGRAGRQIQVKALLCALRQWSPEQSRAAAQLTVDFVRDRTDVVGFDIAGPEDGFPPGQHRAAFELLRRNDVPFTIHAGEAAGVPSIAEAVELGARRLGHGVRIVEDISEGDGPVFGPVATTVRDRQIALETCPCSNIDTRAVPSLADHPLRRLYDWGFAVTINTDNRLMSGTSMSNEFHIAAELGLSLADLQQLTVTAANSAFIDDAAKAHLVSTLQTTFGEGYRSQPS